MQMIDPENDGRPPAGIAFAELEKALQTERELFEQERIRFAEQRAEDRSRFELIERKRQQQVATLTARNNAVSAELKLAREEYTAVLSSRAWRLASKLNGLVARYPTAARLSLQSVKLAKLVVSLRFAEIYKLLAQRRRTKTFGVALGNSGLFDGSFYLAKYPDLRGYAGSPLQHYVLLGGQEGRDPHPLFDGQWYLASTPGLRECNVNPLFHYLAHPELNPNSYFDGQWYLDQYPDVRASGANPLAHYVAFGAYESKDPSPRFATRWYLEQYPDVGATGLNPLAHFLHLGFAEGRSPSPAQFAVRKGAPVTLTEIHCVKSPQPAAKIGLFVAHSPDGHLKPHVMHYLQSIKKGGIDITLIVAADAPFEASSELLEAVAGLFVRRNEGYDFSAWAHVLRLRPDLLDADVLFLLNDSLIGPFNQRDFDQILTAVQENPADLVGATDNYERTGWHLQSFFLALKKKALTSVAFQSFMNAVTTLTDKDEVINQYELRFAPTLRDAGLKCAALFPAIGKSNPTIYEWQGIIARGFPFIKVMVLRDSFENVDISDWADVVTENGFDAKLAERTISEARRVVPHLRDERSLIALPHPAPASAVLRVALFAPWNFDNGLGVASRSYISALRHAGFLINLYPIERPFHVHRQLAPPFEICDFSGDADVALIQINPEGWDLLLTKPQRELIRRATLRIGLWVWETPSVPPEWVSVMRSVDAVWAPSRYCADVFSDVVDTPVHVVPYVVAPAEGLTSAATMRDVKQALGVSTSDKIILYAFDGSSYLVRKNPFALVTAFEASRLCEKGWKLILKTKHVFDSPEQGKSLSEMVERTPGVVMLNQSLDKEAMRALTESADIYASPHSAEGFGLTVAEAMAQGKLVVATDHSGTRDFLDATCGFPVGYKMQPLKETHGHYESGTEWAFVDHSQLTQALVDAAALVQSGDRRKADAARAKIRQQLSAKAVAGLMRNSLSKLFDQRDGSAGVGR